MGDDEAMAVVVRRAQARDGAGRARLWQEAGAFFAALDPHTAQEPSPQGSRPGTTNSTSGSPWIRWY